LVTPGLLNNARHLRERAEEVRGVAEVLHDPDAKRMMLGIAETYEKLAQRAEERVAKKPP
jgi:hypothetical protein